MQIKGGLGRGLGAIIPRKDQAQVGSDKKVDLDTPAQSLKEVPISKILPNPYQPRHKIEKDQLESLAESLKEYGLLQPLVVQKKGEDQYELIAGHRRLAAAKLAGFTSVPVIIRSAVKSKKLEIALVENVQRQDLNSIEEAEAFKGLMDDFFLDLKDIAKKTGKSIDYIKNSLKLLGLPVKIKQALIENKIGRTHALVLSSIKKRGAQLSLFKKTVENKWSARELKKYIRDHEEKSQRYLEDVFARAKINQPSKKEKSLKFLEAEEIMESILGTKVSVDQRGAVGKIIIEFYSDDDLETILDKIRELS